MWRSSSLDLFTIMHIIFMCSFDLEVLFNQCDLVDVNFSFRFHVVFIHCKRNKMKAN